MPKLNKNFVYDEKKFDIWHKNKYDNLYEFETALKKALNIDTLFPDNFTPNIIENEDNNDYSKIKFTNIPKNTYFIRRQKKFDIWNKHVPIWLDYSGRIYKDKQTKESFLLDPFYKKYETILSELGDHITVYRVKKDFPILHFPFINSFDENYTKAEFNVVGGYETWLSHLCIRNETPICNEGYTADVFTFYNFQHLGAFYEPNYREICIGAKYNNEKYLEKLNEEETDYFLSELSETETDIVSNSSKNSSKTEEILQGGKNIRHKNKNKYTKTNRKKSKTIYRFVKSSRKNTRRKNI